VKARKYRRERYTIPELLVFLVPLLFFLTILYGSLLWTFYVSLSNWSGFAANYDLIGFKWYQILFNNIRFEVDVLNNLKWLIGGVVPTVILAVFLAYLLELAPFPAFESYTRTLILYPVAMSFIVTGTIWSWMYEPKRGVFNTILGAMGIDSPLTFTTNPDTATYWLILIFIWQYLGFAVIIMQSSFRTSELQEMIEAATVDGASKLRILFSVVLPNIRSGILSVYMFYATFQQHLVSMGAALGVIIFLIAFILVIPYTIYTLNKWFE
jgi:ABC-type sugar transport system permease subunit